MVIRNKEELQDRPIEIDLTGPEGNAFVLMGIAKRLYDRYGEETMLLLHNKTWKEVQTEMMAADYEHLLEVLEYYFGDRIILYR